MERGESFVAFTVACFQLPFYSDKSVRYRIIWQSVLKAPLIEWILFPIMAVKSEIREFLPKFLVRGNMTSRPIHLTQGKPNRAVFPIILVLLLFISSGCTQVPGGDGGLSATKAALDAQGTQLAGEKAVSADATQIAFSVQGTIIAQQAAQLTQVAQPNTQIEATQSVLEPTPTAAPTNTPLAPPPTETPPPTDVPPTPTPDFEAWMKSAKILLFEDVAGEYMDRYIKTALDTMDLTYVDVKDAVGDFKAQLLSGTDWDLIITGVEARTGVRGEFFDYLNDSLNNGSSVILEIWDLDELAGGKISSLLLRCGIKFQADWWNPPDETRSIWWLAPDHPIFHEPNEGMSLAHYSVYWSGDVGDLIKLGTGGDATLLAGNLAWEKGSHGTLATCLDGRFIIQTFSTHDYHKEDAILLWQNYIYYGLKNRFAEDPG